MFCIITYCSLSSPSVLHCNVVLYPATVVLNSSVGMRQACPGEMVTYTCIVNQGTALGWIVEPFIIDSDPVRFTTAATTGTSFDCSGVAAVQCAEFNFVATLTSITNSMAILENFTSTLAFTATSRLNRTVVQCRGTVDPMPIISSSTLYVAGTSLLFMLPSS